MKKLLTVLLLLLSLCACAAAEEPDAALWPAYDEETRLWGYIDETGAWAIAPQFYDAQHFHGDCAIVRAEDGEDGNLPAAEGVIDRTGAFVLAPEYHLFDFCEDGVQDVFFVMDGSYDADDLDMGWFYIPERFFTGLHWRECVAHSDGPYVTVDTGEPRRSGLADRATGEIVLPLEYTTTGLYEAAAEDGFIVAERADTGECELIELGVGKVALPEGAGIYYYPGVSEGLIPFEADGQWGYLNTAGEIVIPAQYRYADGFHGGYANVGTWDAEDTNAVIDREGNVLLTIPGESWDVGYCGRIGELLHISWPEDEWGLMRPDATVLCRFKEPASFDVTLYAPTADGPLWVAEAIGDGDYVWHLLSREDWTLHSPGWRDTWGDGAPAAWQPVEAGPACWRYVDAYGETVIGEMTCMYALPFEGALARVAFNECSEGYISREGEVVYRWTVMDDSD